MDCDDFAGCPTPPYPGTLYTNGSGYGFGTRTLDYIGNCAWRDRYWDGHNGIVVYCVGTAWLAILYEDESQACRWTKDDFTTYPMGVYSREGTSGNCLEDLTVSNTP